MSLVSSDLIYQATPTGATTSVSLTRQQGLCITALDRLQVCLRQAKPAQAT